MQMYNKLLLFNIVFSKKKFRSKTKKTETFSRSSGFDKFCTGGEARTPDTWFWRPVLYQLSYTRVFS